MKKPLLVFVSLILSFSILGVSIWKQIDPKVQAQVILKDNVVATAAAEIDYFSLAEDYHLAYPGILPDHPLYFVKMARDRMRLWLTKDVWKRADLLLLYADKRIGAAEALSQGNKLDMAVTTATKAEIYLEQAVNLVKELPDEEVELDSWWGQIWKASVKHEQILMRIKNRVSDTLKSDLDRQEEKARYLRGQAEEVIGNPVEMEMEMRVEKIENEATESGKIEEPRL